MSTSPAAWPDLQRWVRTPAPVPPLLLTSADSPTLVAASDYLASVIACQAETPTPCQQCSGCRLVAQGNHPDIIRLTREKGTWTIKEIRQLLDQLARTSFSASRLVILPEAERLSLPAANALLKSLEEPGERTRYVLTTQWPGRLLATIRSRAQVMRLAVVAPPPTPDMWWPRALAPRLATAKTPLTPEQLQGIADVLSQQLHVVGPTAELKRAYQRLRDYHVIAGKQGNEKLAREVLLLSLPASNGNDRK